MRTRRNGVGSPMVWPTINVCLAVAIITLATGAMQSFRREESKTEDSAPLKASVRQAGDRIAALQARYEELLREREELPDEVPGADLKAMEASRRRLLEELAKLLQELERSEAELKAAEPEQNLSTVLERAIVIIAQATVTPVAEPFYQPVFRVGPGGRMQTGFHFVRSGAAAEDALRDGSDFLRWLDTIDRNRGYVLMLVDPASLETFRAVRAELRRRQITSSWEPHEEGNADIAFVPPGTPGAIANGSWTSTDSRLDLGDWQPPPNPLYVECDRRGVVLQPDGVRLPAQRGQAAEDQFIRVARQRRYVLFLIRPDGFDAFGAYRPLVMQDNIDFGYEPIPQDAWVDY